MKKYIAALLTAALVFLLPLSLPAGAAEKEQHVTLSFGDSIARGYGLQDYQMLSFLPTEDSYLYLWAEAHGEAETENASDFSRTGYTSEQILNSIRGTDGKLLASATEIFISAGGNDLMDCYEAQITRAVTDNREVFEEYGMSFTGDIQSVQTAIFLALIDPSKQAMFDKLAQLCTDETSQKNYDAMVASYQDNLKEMVRIIREKNKQAEIVILSPYDPLQIMTARNGLIDSMSTTLRAQDEAAGALLDDKSLNEKLHVISLLSAFDGKYHEMTNVDILDIHPNKAGHAEIYRLISTELEPLSLSGQTESTVEAAETIGNQPVEISQETAPAAVTNIPAEETGWNIPPVVTYVLFGAACACAAAIVTVFVVRRVKSKKNGK